MKQTTIQRICKSVGIGLHRGSPVNLVLEPAKADTGVVFYRTDLDLEIELNPANVVDTQMATVIGKNSHTISTTEHLLSAIYAYGIDNMRIVLDSDEVPIMDGSSNAFCMLLDEAGIKTLDQNKKILVLKEEIIYEDGDKYVKLKPSKNQEFAFTIKFDHPLIGEQDFKFEFSKENYKKEIARARTFGFLSEVQYLRSKNLALGGSLDNAIVLDENKILNPEGLRYRDEFVRHKILDAIGDLKILGYPIMGSYESFAGSHSLNHKLTKKLLAKASAYELVELSYEEAYEFAKAYA